MLWIIQIRTSAFKLKLCVFSATSQHPKTQPLFFFKYRKIVHNPRLHHESLLFWISFPVVAGMHAFTEFLKLEYSEENILFWQACEEYKKLKCRTEMMCEANRIYSEFVQTEAPRQVGWISVPWGDPQCWVWWWYLLTTVVRAMVRLKPWNNYVTTTPLFDMLLFNVPINGTSIHLFPDQHRL